MQRHTATLGLVLLGLATWVEAQEILVKPYLQPGPASAVGQSDVVLLRWITDPTPGNFEVRYGLSSAKERRATAGRSDLVISSAQRYYRYTSALVGLPPDSRVYYEVLSSGGSVRSSSFLTRRSATNAVEFVVTGDLANNETTHKTTAFWTWTEEPAFVVLVGDLVYDNGRLSEYFRYFWDGWNNTDHPSPEAGAPLLGSVLTHAVIGNHDVGGTNLTRRPDGLGAFYLFTAPTNGPRGYRSLPPVVGAQPSRSAFFRHNAQAYPGLCFYSFDNGPVHGVVLDMNKYVQVNEPALRAWLARDLASTRAPWKIVFCHQPGFHIAADHYEEQRLRLLHPLLEQHGVVLVFAGHVHNYQRSKPLRFAPMSSSADGTVNGRFDLDETFDGQEQTRPRGIIHIVTGAGGAKLHGGQASDSRRAPTGAGLNWAPYTAKFQAGRHSYTHVRATPEEVHLRQIDHGRNVIDEIRIRKWP